MSQRDVLAELQTARVTAPPELRERIRLVAATADPKPPRRFTWRRALVVAVPEASPLQGPDTWPPALRVGTKYGLATARYMARLGQRAEIVELHGSVELAPLVGLVDAIVDLTQTGRTLRENRLRIVDEVGCSTARLIANQASLKTRTQAVQRLVTQIRGTLPLGGGGDAG